MLRRSLRVVTRLQAGQPVDADARRRPRGGRHRPARDPARDRRATGRRARAGARSGPSKVRPSGRSSSASPASTRSGCANATLRRSPVAARSRRPSPRPKLLLGNADTSCNRPCAGPAGASAPCSPGRTARSGPRARRGRRAPGSWSTNSSGRPSAPPPLASSMRPCSCSCPNCSPTRQRSAPNRTSSPISAVLGPDA